MVGGIQFRPPFFLKVIMEYIFWGIGLIAVAVFFMLAVIIGSSYAYSLGVWVGTFLTTLVRQFFN